MVIKSLSQEAKRVIENFLSLAAFQGVTCILPLFTLPYLVRVLGPGKYGLVAFAQAFVFYFVTVIDYGFVHSAPRKVAVSRDHKEELAEVFNSIMFIKIVLMLACFTVFILMVIIFSKFRTNWELYLITFLMVPGNVFFPTWFFQGMEKMKHISVLNTFARVIYLVTIFIFVREQSDYLYVPLLNSLGTIIVGAISLWMIVRNFGIVISLPRKAAVYTELREGWHVFLGLFAGTVYTSSNVFILGLFCSNVIVGYYRAADAIVKAFIAMLSPVSQAMYPYISRLAVTSEKKAVNIFNKALAGMGGFTIILGVMIFVLAPYIVRILLGPKYPGSVAVLRILSLLPFLVCSSGLAASLGLLAFNMNKAYSRVVIFAGIVNLVLAFILTPVYKHIGMAVALVVSEMVALSAVVLCFKYKRPHGINIAADYNPENI